MLPNTRNDLLNDFEFQSLPSFTYQLDMEKNCMAGKCDGVLAMKQAIYKILNTERYENHIYSWNYGIELKSLYGKPTSYVIPELKRRIQEALLQDDRIDSVDGFSFETNQEKILAKFTVHTNLGEFKEEMEVVI